jgi:hypothetical protein
MGSQRQILEELLTDHGIAVFTHKEWVIEVGKDFPGIRAIASVLSSNSDSVIVELNVQILLEKKVLIQECFAGWGETEEIATQDAIANFCATSFHVLLAALWERLEEDQVDVEHWGIGESEWQVFIGGCGIRAVNGSFIEIPEEFFPTIRESIQRLSLTEDLYWVSSFYSNVAEEETIIEVLHNNREWTEVQQAIANIAWPRSNSYYSVRNLLILRRKGR